MRAEIKKRYVVLVLVGLASIAADQVTKIWARGALRSPETRRYVSDPEDGKKDIISVVEDRIQFRLSFNRGAAFGLFSKAKGGRWWLIIVGIAALGLVFYLLHRPESESKMFLVALSLVAGGAIGNLWDRILYGKVTDFIVVWVTPSISWTWPWPAFNIADAVLVAGVGLMMLQILLTWREPEELEEKDPKKDPKNRSSKKEPAKSAKKDGKEENKQNEANEANESKEEISKDADKDPDDDAENADESNGVATKNDEEPDESTKKASEKGSS